MTLKYFADRFAAVRAPRALEQGRNYADIEGGGCHLTIHSNEDSYSVFMKCDDAGGTSTLSVNGRWAIPNLVYSINGGQPAMGTYQSMPEFGEIMGSKFTNDVALSAQIWQQSQIMKSISANAAELQGKLDKFFAQPLRAKETPEGVSFALSHETTRTVLGQPAQGKGFAAVDVWQDNGKICFKGRDDAYYSAGEVVSVDPDGSYSFSYMIGHGANGTPVPVEHALGRLNLDSLNAALECGGNVQGKVPRLLAWEVDMSARRPRGAACL